MDLPTYMQSLPRGGKKRLAISLGVAPSYLSRLISGDRAITAERALKVEQATGGAVTRHDLRPDIDWTGGAVGKASLDHAQTIPLECQSEQTANHAGHISSTAEVSHG